MMPTVLVVDDDRIVSHLVNHALAESRVEVLSAETGASALELLQARPVDLVLLDVMLPDATGLDLFRRIQEIDSRIPVIFITMIGGSDTAIEAMKLGAFDYLPKPLDVVRLRELIQQGLEVRRLTSVPVGLEKDGPARENSDLLIGNGPGMLEVYKTIGRVASQNIPVLIQGESGTGKELVARAIYQHGSRSKGPFLALNCAAIPETLLESELFGHEKGSFTGATSQRIGKFEQCSGGTIFLDEIGDMPLALQAKILRVLQERSFERVGGNLTIRADVRVVAASHRDLEEMAERNQFRTDLLFRLKGVTIQLPPLRERLEDIPELVDHFLARFARELNKDIQRIAPEALDVLKRHAWPGNIRELQSVLKLALLNATGRVLIPEFLPKELLASGGPDAQHSRSDPLNETSEDWESFLQDRLNAGTDNLYAEALERMERRLLTGLLRRTQGNQSRAAKILGITRGNLRNKIRTLGITIEQDIRIENDDDEGA